MDLQTFQISFPIYLHLIFDILWFEILSLMNLIVKAYLSEENLNGLNLSLNTNIFIPYVVNKLKHLYP